MVAHTVRFLSVDGDAHSALGYLIVSSIVSLLLSSIVYSIVSLLLSSIVSLMVFLCSLKSLFPKAVRAVPVCTDRYLKIRGGISLF